jgi:hypothetical protein
MKPVDFAEANMTLQPPRTMYSANISEVTPLRVWSDGEQCVSCWEMSWRERLSALLFGRVWSALLSGESQPPMHLEASTSYFAHSDDK